MSRELFTSITIEGTPDQLFAMLKALKSFETDWQEQYLELQRSGKSGAELDHGYLEYVRCCNCYLKNLTDEELRALAEKSPYGCSVYAEGPSGSFYEPSEIGLFEALAQAAPDAAFSGEIEGLAWGAEFRHTAELKNGHLALSSKVSDNGDDEYEEDWEEDEEDWDEEEELEEFSAPASVIPPSWTTGDAVFHAAFGKGTILQVMPLGNDNMLRIAFDNVGTRMLMANTAAAHLKKL